jgi:signal transduction histidine kinase
VEGFAKRSGIQVNLQIPERQERLESTVELVLFRALQETLTNVHRHSGAKQADVSLNSSEGRLVLSVRDHGQGIPATILKNLIEQGSAGGVGLAGMTERLREIGGRLEIVSNGNGTEVIVRVPVRHRQPPIQFLSSVTEEVRG